MTQCSARKYEETGGTRDPEKKTGDDKNFPALPLELTASEDTVVETARGTEQSSFNLSQELP